ncbi:unnamed protein product [Diplocarpon coronariae]|nr:hypothetical protein JHW43_002121 [Diplocarpon mali]
MPLTVGPRPQRRKKRKSRTEVSSDISSDSEPETSKSISPSSTSPISREKTRNADGDSSGASTSPEPSAPTRELTVQQVDAAFTQIYMERATREFEDDLEKLRTSEDFRNESLPMLIAALQGGTSLFSEGEKRRIVNAGKEEGGK